MGGAVLSVGALTAVSAATPPTSIRSTVSLESSPAPRAVTGPVQVFWRGNGHGHGMSQYGAHGAAMQGLSTAQILAFYYPGTKLTKVAASTIRVLLSSATANTTVFAGTKGLALSGYGTLPASGYTRFRLVPSGSGLRLDGFRTASAGKPAKWIGIKNGLPARADFSSSLGWVQTLFSDGSSTRYRGTVGAVRSGSSELTINRASLDQYVEGSVPREMPISWEPAAYHAQAVAARSYAESVRANSGGAQYDICDTPSCQVYGGMAHYDSDGDLLWTDAPQAIAGNENTVLRYAGQPVFAQYSASNGGAMTAGGRPYLVSKSDPYDNAASGDPYLDETGSPSGSSIARNLGLNTMTSISSVKRDGYGPWGGRIVSAKVSGTTYSGAATTVSVDGFDLGYAMGAGTDYLRFDMPTTATTPSAPQRVTTTAGDGGATVAWSPPASTGGAAITGYRISFGAHVQVVSAGTRSTWVGPLNNAKASTVSVRAVNAQGYGPATSIAAKGVATPRRMVAVAPLRVFDTRTSNTVVDPTHPYQVTLPGKGALPKTGVRSVQLSLSIVSPTRSGVLHISPAGAVDQPVAAVAYVAAHTVTATVSVPLPPSGAIRLTPSAGRVQLAAEQQAYTADTGGSKLTVTTPVTVAEIDSVPTTTGSAIDLADTPGVTSSTTGVVLAIDASGPKPAGLSIWPDGTPAPKVRQVSVTSWASGTNTVVLPLGADRTLRLLATTSGVTARVRLVGVLGASGGGLVTYPASMVADGAKVVKLGTGAVSVPVAGVNQVPSSGARAVLVHLTVAPGSAAGQLWAYPSGTSAPAAPVVRFGSGVTTTATALLLLGTNGAVTVRSSVAGVTVALDSVGYATAR